MINHTKTALDLSQGWNVRTDQNQPLKLTISKGHQNGDNGSASTLPPDVIPDLVDMHPSQSAFNLSDFLT